MNWTPIKKRMEEEKDMICKFKRKTFLGVFSLALVLCLTACGGGGGQAPANGESKDKAGDLTVGVTSFADTLEPTEQYFSWVITRYGVGETLVKFNEEGEVIPGLAKSWSVSDDQKTWTFDLEEGVKFSNGKAMDGQAVKASIERTFELSDRAKEFFDYEKIEADGNKLMITTKEPVAMLSGSLADPLFLIVDASANTEEFASKGPICTGPYKVESFSPAQETVVVANENYRGQVPLNKVTFRCIEDQATRSMALQSGEIQVAYNLKTENLADFQGHENIETQELDSLRTTMAFMNENGPLKDKALRQAFIRGLDRKTYTESLLGGGASPGKTVIPPTLDFGFDKIKDENAYNPESAKEILKQAGYVDKDGDGFVENKDGSKLELNFVIYTSREELGIYAQAAQTSLKEIGLKVNLETVSYETLLDRRDAGQYDLLIWNVLVANTGDPEKYLRENFYSSSKSNTMAYKNEKVDQDLDELVKTFDDEKRKDLVMEIQDEIMKDAGVAVFGYEKTLLFYDKSVQGLELFPMDYYWLTDQVSLEK